MKDQMTVRQTACFCAISMLALKLVALPSILYEKSESSGLLIAGALFLFDFLILYIFLKVKQKYPTLSLYELIHKIVGKIIAKIVYCAMFVFFITKLLMLMNEAVSFMQSIVDEDYSVLLFLLTFLPVITALSASGLKSTARTCEFGYIFIVIGLIVCLFLSETSAIFGNLGPMFNNSFGNILGTSFDVSFWFSDFIFVAVLSDKIKLEPCTIKTVFKFVIFIAFIIMLLYYAYFRLFRVTAFLHKNAIADVTQYNREIGNVGNIDIISILAYMFVIFFQGALYANCLKVVYEKIVGYKNKTHSLIVLNLFIIFLQYFLFFSLERMTVFVFNYFKYANILILFVIPLFYTGLLIFDREKKYVKNYKKIYKKV